jgi:hypothetical protein
MVQPFFCTSNHSIEPGWGIGLNSLWLAALRSGFFIGRQFCEFGPAGWGQVVGIFGLHFDSAVEADSEVLA